MLTHITLAGALLLAAGTHLGVAHLGVAPTLARNEIAPTAAAAWASISASGAAPLAVMCIGNDSAQVRKDIEALSAAMVSALKASPASVAKFYRDDAQIVGGGSRVSGRAQIDAYWASATIFADWKLEILDCGGDRTSPWLRGRSTLIDRNGRNMVTEFVGILKRATDGSLKYFVDMYAAAPAPVAPLLEI